MPNEKFARQVDEKKPKNANKPNTNLQTKMLSKKPNFSYLASKNAKWQPCRRQLVGAAVWRSGSALVSVNEVNLLSNPVSM